MPNRNDVWQTACGNKRPRHLHEDPHATRSHAPDLTEHVRESWEMGRRCLSVSCGRRSEASESWHREHPDRMQPEVRLHAGSPLHKGDVTATANGRSEMEAAAGQTLIFTDSGSRLTWTKRALEDLKKSVTQIVVISFFHNGQFSSFGFSFFVFVFLFCFYSRYDSVQKIMAVSCADFGLFSETLA